MGHEEFADQEFSGLPDVASARLSELLSGNAALDKAIRDLVALLKDPREVTLGWANFVSPGIGSGEPNSTSSPVVVRPPQ